MKEGLIVDFHMHPYLHSYQNMCGHGKIYEGNPLEVKAQLEKAGIGHVCGSVIERQVKQADFAYLRQLNRDALELKELYGDFYTPGFHVHPSYAEESCEEIDFMQKKGVYLIGELVPYLHGWDNLQSTGMMEILDKAQEYQMIVSYHSADYEVEEMIASYPDITFVAAHPGERPCVERHIERMRKYENLYLDLSGTGLFRFGMLRYLVDKIGADRILFGTDYPICNPGMYVQAVQYENLTDRERELILCKNAERILRR